MVITCFLSCVFFSSCSQVILKLGANRGYRGLKSYLNPYVITGYSVFLLMTLCSTYLYRYLPLSLGTLLDCCGYIFIAALSTGFLKEKWNKKKSIGLGLILGGILLALL